MISVVVPLYNEAESLATLHAELARTFESGGLGPAEFLFVDDGSRDGSWAVIRALATADPRVRGIRFRRNFGKAAALTAGFRAARGSIVFTLDGDLQDDPAEIPRFLAKLDEGESFDVVSGWKRTRHDPWHKVGPSRVFNRMVSALTGCKLHDHNCGFKAYRREVLDEVDPLRRAPPVRPRPGPRAGLPRRRDRRQPPAPQVRPLQVRGRPVHQGAARPPDRPLPLAVRPEAPARPGGARPGDAGDGRPGHDLPGGDLG